MTRNTKTTNDAHTQQETKPRSTTHFTQSTRTEANVQELRILKRSITFVKRDRPAGQEQVIWHNNWDFVLEFAQFVDD